MRIATFLFFCLVLTVGVRADTVPNVAQWLMQNETVPLTINMADTLALNLIEAQGLSAYAGNEPDSLLLSEESVERALGISWAIALLQSGIAIDDRVTVSLSPTSLNFGTVPIVSTPESSVTLMLIVGFVLLIVVRRSLA